jgi:hypothetical protein
VTTATAPTVMTLQRLAGEAFIARDVSQAWDEARRRYATLGQVRSSAKSARLELGLALVELRKATPAGRWSAELMRREINGKTAQRALKDACDHLEIVGQELVEILGARAGRGGTLPPTTEQNLSLRTRVPCQTPENAGAASEPGYVWSDEFQAMVPVQAPEQLEEEDEGEGDPDQGGGVAVDDRSNGVGSHLVGLGPGQETSGSTSPGAREDAPHQPRPVAGQPGGPAFSQPAAPIAVQRRRGTGRAGDPNQLSLEAEYEAASLLARCIERLWEAFKRGRRAIGGAAAMQDIAHRVEAITPKDQ